MDCFNPISKINPYKKPCKTLSRGKYNKPMLCQVDKLNLNCNGIKHIKRGGCLPYTIYNGRLYICFGRHNPSRDLTDFGGGKQSNEDIIDCAVRECNEETRGVFGKITRSIVNRFNCLYNSEMLIILIYIEEADGGNIIENSKHQFDNNLRDLIRNNIFSKNKKKEYLEISELVWVSEEQIENISNLPLFNKVRRFLLSSGLFSSQNSNIDFMNGTECQVESNNNIMVTEICYA